MAQIIEVPNHGQVEFPDDMSEKDIVAAIKRNSMSYKRGPKDVGMTDLARAGASGINKGFYSDLIGLPVDTAANVVDLGKAGFGYLAGKFGRPDLMPDVSLNRDGTPGSSDWIAKKINQAGMGGAINNPNPQDALSRIAYSGGRVGGASIVPNPSAQISLARNAGNIGTGIAGGLAAGSIGEIAPEWAGLAGMVPQIAGAAARAGTKRIVRGGEQGRQNMEQRMQDFKNAGVDEPSVGLASGNKFIMGLENLLAQTPGSTSLYATAKQKMVDGMQSKTNQIRDEVSTDYGPVEAGAAIQRDLKGPFKDRIGATTSALGEKVESAVGDGFYTAPNNSIASARGMSTPIPGAEATSTPLINGRIAEIARNLASDVVGDPIKSTSLMNAPTQYRRFDGEISATPPGIPFRALKNLRTDIGKEASSNAIIGTPEQSKFKRLYGAMSEDMKQAVNAADRENSGVDVGPLMLSQQPASVALNRTNNYYSKAMGRVEDLNSLANRDTPEGAFGAVSRSLNAGPTAFERVRNSVTPATRQKVVATVIDELGMANPGQQGAAGDAWSPATFLTNFNKIDPKAKTELFKRLPGGARHAENLGSIAKAAEMIGDGSKVWSNSSGTAAALSARGTIGALTVGAYFSPITAAGTAAGLALSHQASQRLLLNPAFANWLAKIPEVRPQDAQAYAQRLIANSKMMNDKQFQQDVIDYLSSVE